MDHGQEGRKSPERYFYHSFPRGTDKMDGVGKGLTILQSMKEMGLLLTPEIPKWPDNVSGDPLSEPWSVAQIRCCFTLLQPFELLQHAKVFGHFAIEFDIKELRKFGAIPVFYLPTILEPDDASGVLAAKLVGCIGQIDELLCRLKLTEDSIGGDTNRDKPLGIMKDGRLVRQTTCSVGGIEDLLSFLGEGHQPLINLWAGLRALSGFFFPTEDLNTDLVGYYHEREWRILSSAAKNGVKLARCLDKHEEEFLLRLDRNFFGEPMAFRDGQRRRVDKCRVLEELDGKPTLRHARRIIVPQAALTRAKEMLDESDDKPVVALESLGTSSFC